MIASRSPGLAAITFDHLFKARFRLVGMIERIQVERELNLRIGVERRI